MRYIEAFSKVHESHYTVPNSVEYSIFLAGGIIGCNDWQKEVAGRLVYYPFVVINPRRECWDVTDTSESERQIKWEHEHLRLASTILFWFPKETLCPITLFEYGKCLVGNKRIHVGCHELYQRKLDLEVQTKLERPFQKVHTSLSSLCEELISSY